MSISFISVVNPPRPFARAFERSEWQEYAVLDAYNPKSEAHVNVGSHINSFAMLTALCG